jgi:hypothetical protein
MANPTAELNAFTFAVVKVLDADPPGATMLLDALDDSVKLPVDCTVRLNARVLVVPPPTAPIVRAETPAAAAELTASVKVLFPLPGAAMLVGLRLAVTPLGSPLMERYTVDLNPVPAVVVKVMGTEPPGAKLVLEALAVSVKLGFATAKVMV